MNFRIILLNFVKEVVQNRPPAMDHNNIRIKIQLEKGQIAQLQLSPTSYKESFREFKRQHHITESQAFKLKNLIQSKLIEMLHTKQSWHFFTPPRQQETLRQEPVIESPRFRKVDVEDIGTDPLIEQSRVQMIFTKQEQESQRDFLEQLPLTPRHPGNLSPLLYLSQQKQQDHEVDLPKTNCFENTQNTDRYYLDDQPMPQPAVPPIKHPSLFPQQDDTNKNFHPNPQQLGKLHSKPKSQLGRKQQKRSIKRKVEAERLIEAQKSNLERISSPKRSPRGERFDRLHYQVTDSFRSKHNEDVDRRELVDYLEVQKYELSNRLKRTSYQFFYHLHQGTTESWRQRMSPSRQKIQEESIIYQSPPKKVSLEKAYKGSSWNSRMRCQANEYQKQKNAEKAAKNAKEQAIKQRMRQERSGKTTKKSKQKVYLSRVCEKCSPKKSESPQKQKEIPMKKSHRQVHTQKRRYMSDLLLEASQQINRFATNIKRF